MNTWRELLQALHTFVRQTHTTGLVWNSAPVSAKVTVVVKLCNFAGQRTASGCRRTGRSSSGASGAWTRWTAAAPAASSTAR